MDEEKERETEKKDDLWIDLVNFGFLVFFSQETKDCDPSVFLEKQNTCDSIPNPSLVYKHYR